MAAVVVAPDRSDENGFMSGLPDGQSKTDRRDDGDAGDGDDDVFSQVCSVMRGRAARECWQSL